jgi:RNA polymerase sigma-70 factor (ECF subfamily)
VTSGDGGLLSFHSLIRAAQRGDRDSFDRLASGYRAFLLDVAERGMDRLLRSVVEPEDVVQDVLLSAFRSLGTVDLPSPAAFRAWLGTIARNRLNDLRRRHLAAKRREDEKRSLEEPVGTASSGGSAHLGDGIAARDPSPSSLAGRREKAEALEQVLARIAPHFREVIRLVEVEHLSTAEIAVRVGKSPEAVRKRIERALRACRAEFARAGMLRGKGRGEG